MKRVRDIFRSLWNPNYRLWATGALISNVGTWMQRVGQDWLVLTQLTHHSASAVGIVEALQFGPQLLFLPWTGFAADHFDQRKLLMATQATMCVLALALGALTVAGVVQLWHVYVFAFLFGSAAAFDAPVRQTFVVTLVSEEDIPNAIGLNSTSFNAARMIGPAVAGMTIAAIGTGWAFVANGLSFMAVLLTIGVLRVSALHKSARATRTKGGFREGIRYVRSRADLKAILLMLFLMGTFGLNFSIFIATMAVRELHVDARGFGLLTSIMAVGTLTGALITAARTTVDFKSLLQSTAVFGGGCALAALAPNFWVFAVALVVVGVSALVFVNATNSLMQLTTEPALRGRVMAIRLGVLVGCTPIGAPLVGWVADHPGPRWALGLGLVGGVASAVTAARFLRQYPRGEQVPQVPDPSDPEELPQ